MRQKIWQAERLENQVPEPCWPVCDACLASCSSSLTTRSSSSTSGVPACLDEDIEHRCFKEDVCQPVVPLNCYPTTLRRRIVDVAGKIVRHAGQILLKVTAATWKQLQIDRLWRKSAHPPPFAWV